eukprot:TRINITY_DN76522_c0_g1_i1.p1 TRINITY_DN76522_c0_g1~~TRINITY_DN76522_c0_g1_i1.p1  ORF type:complete len:680 (+),score=135.38 TRINITY_DN76522_c0_g1_i1:113-2152(+)
MLGSATEDAVLRRLINPSDSQAAQDALDNMLDARMKRLSSKRAAKALSKNSSQAAGHVSLKAPVALASLETGQSQSQSHSCTSSRAHSHAQLALLPLESPTQIQSLALAITASHTPSKAHQSFPPTSPSSHSHSSHTESLLESALAIPFQSPPQEQAVRYQNQLMATRPWLQAMVGKKLAGSDKHLYRTASLPAVQGASPNSSLAKKKIAPRKKSKPPSDRQKAGNSGWLKGPKARQDEDEEDEEAGGFGSMWLDFAPDEKVKIEIKDPKQPQDILVPESVKKLNYWQALQSFHAHDSKKRGFLDRNQFWALLGAVCGDEERITKQRAYAIYDNIDVDESGTMEKDEFMGWAFQTHNNYLAAVRKRLETMEPRKVRELFAKSDSNNNGLIDQDEFWEFVEKFSPYAMTRQASDELHAFIDADSSGEIDLDEFLNWVHPGRELRILMGESDVDRPRYGTSKKDAPLNKSMLPKGLSALGTRASEEDTFVRPDKPMMESEPGKPVVLEFTIGREFLGSIAAVKKSLRNVFGPNQLKFETLYDPASAEGCTKVEAKVGRGIVLWERDRMIQHREDPFESIKSAEMWIKDVLAECLPDVVGAANLRFQQRIRKNECWTCSKSLEGITPIMIENVPVCGRDCALVLRRELLGVYDIEARVQREKRRLNRAAEAAKGSSGAQMTA